MSKMLEAVKVYRDSPNTFGHETNDVPRRRLKQLMGAVATQRFLQESIADEIASGEYTEESKGIRHLWERLKASEDVLREAEAGFDEKIASLPFKTLPGRVHPVPAIAMQLMKMEAAQAV